MILRAGILALAAFAAQAQNYPVKPVKLMVGVPPGGPTDALARAIAPDLSEALGQGIVIENRAGASGVIATDLTAKAAPEGYTLAFIFITHATNPALIARLPYDTLRDFAAVSMVGQQSMLLLAHLSFAPSSVQELIAAAKARPGQLDYGASDAGSAPHLAGELFKLMSGTSIPFMFISNITGLPQVQSGKLKALAVTGAQRSALAPNVPTVSESGLPGYEVYGWYGVVAPARTPKPVIARLHAEIAKIAQSPKMKSRLAGQGLELVGNSPEEFDAHIRSEIAKWEKVLRAAGIRPEGS